MKTSILLALCASAFATDPSPPTPPPPVEAQDQTASVESATPGSPLPGSPDDASAAQESPGHAAAAPDPSDPPTDAPSSRRGTAREGHATDPVEPTSDDTAPSGTPVEGPQSVEDRKVTPPSPPGPATPTAPDEAPVPAPPEPTASASRASHGDDHIRGPQTPVPASPPSPSPIASGAESFSLSELTAGEAWLEQLLRSATTPSTAPPAQTPDVELAYAPGSHAPSTGDSPRLPRLFWLFVAMLATNLASRVARRRTPGRVRRLLDRLVALGRAASLLAGLGLVIALLPPQWRPWALVLGASAAAALGWSLRPRLADLVAGIYLGLRGRLSPGAPVQLSDAMGLLHQPGPWSSVVRMESGALRTVPNRLLQVVASRSWQSGRRSITVSVPIPSNTDPNDALAAVRWVCDLLPWTADDPPAIQIPPADPTAAWTVQLIVLGDAPPSDRVRVLFPRLVCDVLQCGKVSQAPPPSVG